MPITSCHRFKEPCWQQAERNTEPLSSRQRDWLLNQGSLTERLVQASGAQFSVTILRQSLQLPYLSERRLLKLKHHQLALVREVILSGKGQPWVFARSIVPLTTLTGRLRALRQLDNRPLGALLFKDPSMERSSIEVARLNNNHHYLPSDYKTEQAQWGRRSVFRLDHKPLLVSEVFLSSFPFI